MELFEVLKKRHSYRGAFTSSTVPREDLRKIVAAGLLAPSGCNAQTAAFIIVDDADLLRQIGDIVDKPVVRAAHALIVCLMHDKPVYHGMAFGVEDCAIATENMLLAITALGYASVWLDGALRLENRAEQIAALLDVPSDHTVRIVLPIGIPAETRSQPPKRPFEARAAFNRFSPSAPPAD